MKTVSFIRNNIKTINLSLTAIISLLMVQLVFYQIQKLQSNDISKGLQSILAKEIKGMDSYFLSKAILNLERLGLFECSVLISGKLQEIPYLNLRYNNDCNDSIIKLNGINVTEKISAINGSTWTLSYKTKNSHQFYVFLWIFRIFTLSVVFLIYRYIYLKSINRIEVLTLENQLNIKINRITKQVAHDIRSPLAALDMAINKFKDSEVPHKELIIQSAKRIHEIADDLVTRSKASSQTGSNPAELITTDIAKLVRSIYNEKVVQHESNSNINFSIDTKQCFVNTNPKELGRAISNIINNAVEALNEKGNISITVDYNNTDASIKITDNGKGIPSDILKKLGNEGESHGKDKGLGLGIFHAKQTTELSQGKLIIDSTEGYGTTVTLSIPLQTQNSSEYILIDDDELTRMSWEIAAKENKIDLYTFSSIQEFNKQLELIDKNTTIYIDVDLPDGNGVELAKNLFKLKFRNLYLATGHSGKEFEDLSFLKGVHSKNPPF